jgi:mannan endo-1,4-beta-mannosidase
LPSSPTLELNFLDGPTKPPRRPYTDPADYAHRRSRRTRIICWCLVLALLALSVGVWQSPAVHRPNRNTTDLALVSQKARADDLKHQVDELADRLRDGHPIEIDTTDRARADDLAQQVEELERRLGLRRPPVTNRSDAARAEDLSRRLKDLQQHVQQPRPPVTDGVQKARADDLAQRVHDLSNQLAQPRTTVGRFDGVSAATKAEIVGAGHYFGLYTAQSPFNFGEAGMIEERVGRKANIVGYFQDWTDPFRADAIQASWQRHQIPLLTWEPAPSTGRNQGDDPAYSLPAIIGGAHDDYIRSYARGIHALGMPVVLRLAHEMNGDWYPWSEVGWRDLNHDDKATIDERVSINGNGRGDYRRMWRHVHDIFEQEGANDYTVWLWAPNRVDNLTAAQPDVEEFYPGDDVVDWIGMSGYLRPSDHTPTFNSTYAATLAQLRSTAAKPIMLAEIGATELNGTKVAWTNSLFDGLAGNGDIIGFCWFSLTVSAMQGDGVQTNDWRINSTSAAADAVAHGLASVNFGTPVG